MKSKSDLETRLSTVESQLALLVSPGQIFTGRISQFNVADATGGRGPQISFTITNFNQLAEVDILRNVSIDPGSALNIQKYTHLSPTGTTSYSYNDADPSIVGSKVNYWIRVVLTNPDAQPILQGPFPAQA